jgi:Leucine-rich repeat (LRR) protein
MMTSHYRTRSERTKQGWRIAAFALMSCLLLAAFAGCGANKLDPTAETIVITSLSQLENESFAGFDQLRTLDLRAVSVDSARVDEIRTALPDCEILWSVPLASAVFDSASNELVLPQDCSATDLVQLKYFPALTHVDATACTVDEAFAVAAADYPHITFVWNTTIDGVPVKSTDTMLNLSGVRTVSPVQVGPFLLGLPLLEQVDCSDSGWSADGIAALQLAYPNIEFICDVDVFGTRVRVSTQTLDMTNTAVDFDALPEILGQLRELNSVNLEGQQVSFEQMDALMTAFPQIAFSFSFELFERQLTTQTTELDLTGYPLSSPEEIASKLQYLPNLTHANLSHCGLTNEQMEQLIAQFPSIKFVWVIKIGAWEVRTDITAFSKGNRTEFPNGMGYFTGEGKTNFYNEDIQVLKFCKDLVYLDLGHGNRIDDVSVLAQLKNLRVLIVSMNKIKDFSPLAELKELECLEIFQNPLADISPVAALPKLKYLNCSSTLFEDITPLLGLKNLEMLWFISVRNVTKEQRQQLSEALPDCNICFSAGSSGEGGWTGNPLYIEYQTAFGLPYDQ